MQPDLSPEDAKAALGLSTRITEQMLMAQAPQQPQEGSQTPNPAPETPSNQTTPEDVKAEIQGLETRLMDELNTLKSEMKTQGDGKQELADLKKQIEEILNSND